MWKLNQQHKDQIDKDADLSPRVIQKQGPKWWKELIETSQHVRVQPKEEGITTRS